jgi:signal transduction histidine kinase
MSALFFARRLMVAFAAIAVLSNGVAFAAGKGTEAEAEAMVAKAIAHIKKVGAEKAYSDFTNAPEWKDRDLYVFVNELSTGKNLAHGANSKLVGKEVLNLRDPDGKFPNKILDDLVKAKGKGWGEVIKFMNPVTQTMSRRKVYAERLGNTLVACGVFLD